MMRKLALLAVGVAVLVGIYSGYVHLNTPSAYSIIIECHGEKCERTILALYPTGRIETIENDTAQAQRINELAYQPLARSIISSASGLMVEQLALHFEQQGRTRQ